MIYLLSDWILINKNNFFEFYFEIKLILFIYNLSKNGLMNNILNIK